MNHSFSNIKLRFRASFCLAALLLLTLLAPGSASAVSGPPHPYHVSSAEVRWNPATGNFEIALCVWPADLEQALARHTGKSVDLDQANDLDATLKDYIAENFLIERAADPLLQADSANNGSTTTESAQTANAVTTTAPAERPDVRWVGSEISLKQAWLYFEIPGDKSAAQWTIENGIFRELNDDQINQIQLTVGAESVSIGLTETAPSHTFQTN